MNEVLAEKRKQHQSANISFIQGQSVLLLLLTSNECEMGKRWMVTREVYIDNNTMVVELLES